MVDDESEPFAQGYASVGAHYLITPDLEVGIRIGWGLTDDSA
jgi:hypothetical protein